MLGSAERGKIRLISREIIFQEFKPIYDHDTSTSQTDTHTDGQTTCHGNTALCVKKLRNTICAHTSCDFATADDTVTVTVAHIHAVLRRAMYIAHLHEFAGLLDLLACCAHRLEVREYVFYVFLKITQKRHFLRFLKWHIKNNVKT